MDLVAIIVSFLGVLISGVALYFSKQASEKAEAASSEANKISNEQLKINNAIIETEIRKSIEETNARVNDIALEIVPLSAKIECNEATNVEKKTHEMYQANFKASIQAMLNMYDDACTKYIDNKIDRERFKRNFIVEIRNLIERNSLKEYFDPITSTYKAILKVYNEWENLEK